MKTKELRALGVEELNSKLEELRKEMIKHNAQIATGTTPKSPGQIKEIKKTVARIMTIVDEKAKAGEKTSSKVDKSEEE